MSDVESPPPPLRLRELVVHAVRLGDAPATPHVPRDLPDLARFLFFALAADANAEESVLDKVTLDVERGQCTALVGEDGSGKSTLARACARLLSPSSGSIEVNGVDIHRARGGLRLRVRRSIHVLFDDPEAALDPRRTLRESFDLVEEALRLDASTRDDRTRRALDRARLKREHLDERAGDLGAGARKRAALARALLSEPSVLVVDEPAGGLDPSDRALALETLAALRADGPALLVLTKDLGAARTLAQKVGVLHAGALVELGAPSLVLESPTHPVAQALVAAAPRVRLGR